MGNLWAYWKKINNRLCVWLLKDFCLQNIKMGNRYETFFRMFLILNKNQWMIIDLIFQLNLETILSTYKIYPFVFTHSVIVSWNTIDTVPYILYWVYSLQMNCFSRSGTTRSYFLGLVCICTLPILIKVH